MMHREMNDMSSSDDKAFNARLRAEAARVRYETPPGFTARVMRDLPAQPDAADEEVVLTRPMEIQPLRVARIQLAAAVIALAVLSGMYLGAPWTATTNDSVATVDSPNVIAPSETNPTLIHRPRVTIDFGVRKTLQEEATRFLAHANSIREVFINRLPLQGRAAARDSSG